mgnify:CR=1 FL=1
MTWQNYQLDSTILKADEDMTLWQTEKGMIKIDKNTLAVPIKLAGRPKGFIFHGNSKLLLDTIVETQEGAIGKPVEKEMNEPFLMLGETKEIPQHLTPAGKEDLTNIGYKNEQEFIAKADDLCCKFFREGKTHVHQCFDEDQSFIFAFPNKAGKLDILVAKGSKLVYKAMDRVFVSDKNKVVLKTPKEVILSSNRRSFVIKK